jgi:micrococcal nuclease
VLNPTQQTAVIERVRLIGIEAPDLKQHPWGAAAKDRFEQMISKITVSNSSYNLFYWSQIYRRKDSSGRWLAYVWYDAVLLNEQTGSRGLCASRTAIAQQQIRFSHCPCPGIRQNHGIWHLESRPTHALDTGRISSSKFLGFVQK